MNHWSQEMFLSCLTKKLDILTQRKVVFLMFEAMYWLLTGIYATNA